MADLRLSVIIPVWNGRALLAECLDALMAEQPALHEIIAVDNGSADGSAGLIECNYPQVRLIRNAQNLGFAAACNIGMRAATGDIFVLLNQDTRVEAGWGAALRAAFSGKDADEIGIVGCQIRAAADRALQHAGGYVHPVLGMPFHYGKTDAEAVLGDTPRTVEYVTGAAMAIPRRVLAQIGGFDERFFPAYYEDVDLCFRARAEGFKILYWPAARVLHHESASTPDTARWFYFQRGRTRFVLKHWPFRRLVDEFPAAEAGFQVAFCRDFGSTRPLRLAYTAARIEAAAIAADRWPGDDHKLAQISAVLRRLYREALMVEFAQACPTRDAGSPPISATDRTDVLATMSSLREAAAALPALTEFEFRSALPVVGPLVALIRRTWSAVAAKWAIRHLIHQQQAINQELAKRLQQLTDAVLALERQQIAQLRDLDAQERQADATNRFLLESIAQAEEETMFALLWPLRWDFVLNPITSSPEAA